MLAEAAGSRAAAARTAANCRLYKPPPKREETETEALFASMGAIQARTRHTDDPDELNPQGRRRRRVRRQYRTLTDTSDIDGMKPRVYQTTDGRFLNGEGSRRRASPSATRPSSSRSRSSTTRRDCGRRRRTGYARRRQERRIHGDDTAAARPRRRRRRSRGSAAGAAEGSSPPSAARYAAEAAARGGGGGGWRGAVRADEPTRR